MKKSEKYDFKVINDEKYEGYIKATICSVEDECFIDYASSCEATDDCFIDFT